MDIQPIQRRLAEATSSPIPERADQIDEVADQRRSMEVRWRELGFRVSINRYRSVALMNEDVVVDAEVGVVEVLVFAADLYCPAAGQKRQRLAEPLRAPDRLSDGATLFLEPPTRLVGRDTATDHGVPEREAYPLGIHLAKLASNRVAKLVPG